MDNNRSDQIAQMRERGAPEWFIRAADRACTGLNTTPDALGKKLIVLGTGLGIMGAALISYGLTYGCGC